jgi:hypothetical protein
MEASAWDAGVLAKPVNNQGFLLGKQRLSSGAPEEIRTPDPQIRSLILSNSLTFLCFP